MRIIGGILFTVAVIAAGLVGYVYSGAYNIAATDPHTEVGQWLLATTKEQSIAGHAKGLATPPLDDPQRVLAGFRHFKQSCEACHGAPGVSGGAFTKGMRPEPPDLAHASEHWDSAELFWIAKHGIKLTGMPAWEQVHSDEELWSIVAFMQRLPRLSAAEYRRFESMFAAFETKEE